MAEVMLVVMVATPPLSSNIAKTDGSEDESGTLAATPELCNCDGKKKNKSV
jgi:hypothetical protein